MGTGVNGVYGSKRKPRKTLTWSLEKSAPPCPDFFFGSHICTNLSLISAGVRCKLLCSPQELYKPAACTHSLAHTHDVPATVSITCGAVCCNSNISMQHKKDGRASPTMLRSLNEWNPGMHVSMPKLQLYMHYLNGPLVHIEGRGGGGAASEGKRVREALWHNSTYICW